MAEKKKTKRIKKKWHPKFRRPNAGAPTRRRVGFSWRRPRGHDNKQKEGRKGPGYRPGIGYRQPRSIRGLHPSGTRPVLVRNIEQVMNAKEAVIIAAGLGKKKRAAVLKIAKQKNLKVINA